MTANIQNGSRDLDMTTLHNLWLERFNEYSYNNERFGLIALHMVIGQLLKYQHIPKRGQTLDLRIHIYPMMDTGSGKSVAVDMIRNMTDQLQLKTISLDEITDASLIGTIVAQNDPETGEVEYVTTPGVLEDADIIHFDEAEVLFNPGKHNQNAKIYFQKAMNPIGTASNLINKKLAHGDMIEVPVHGSFLFTSYVPMQFEQTVVHTGFLPRIVMEPKELHTSDRIKNSSLDIDALGEHAQFANNDTDILSILRQIQNIGKTKIDFNFKHVKPLLKNKTNIMYDLGQNSSHLAQKLINGFIPRYQNHLYVLAAHMAIINDRQNIRTEDVNFTFNNMIYPSLSNMLSLIEVSTNQSKIGVSKEQSYLVSATKEYKKLTTKPGQWIGAKALGDRLAVISFVSKKTGRRRLNTLIEKGHFETVTYGNTIMVRASE